MPYKIIVGIAIVFVVLLVAGWSIFRAQSSEEFSEKYMTYKALADAHETAAYLPGSPTNPIRQELNTVLSQVLTSGLSMEERLRHAENGLALLKISERQIDAIGEHAEVVDRSILALEHSLPMSVIGTGMEEVIELAKRRAAIIADIRGLSYRANFHTSEILSRIVQDEGKLTDAHVIDLNAQIPQVEEQFDARANLYSELEGIDGQLERAYTSVHGQ